MGARDEVSEQAGRCGMAGELLGTWGEAQKESSAPAEGGMTGRIKWNEEWLRLSYEIECRSTAYIAEVMGCSRSAVQRAFNRLGIHFREENAKGKLAQVTEQWLEKKYWEEGLSTRQIAELLDCSDSAIQKRMKKFGISRRKGAIRSRLPLQRDILMEMYSIRGRTQQQIAEALGCSRGHVLKEMRRLDVPTRSAWGKSIEERFWEKVTIGNQSECWNWKGTVSGKYGRFYLDGRLRVAHMVSWELSFGEIPDSMFIHRHCRNSLCCNPSHLFLAQSSRVAARES